jgi:hypothetical protein
LITLSISSSINTHVWQTMFHTHKNQCRKLLSCKFYLKT